MEESGSIRYSVVIPTCNRVNLLPRALDSVLSQTFPAFEIIVVDDGSTDQTDTLIRRNYPGVTCIRQSNSGVSTARNRGIAASTGNWIALLDSDDEWLPEKMERQFQVLLSSPEMLICHTDEIWIRDGKRVNPKNKHAKPEGWIFNACLPLCCVSPSSIVIHRSVLDEIGLFDPAFPACEDYDLWLRMFSRFPVLLVNQKLTIKYGGHDDQLSRKYWGMDRFRIRALDKLLASNSLTPEQENGSRKMLASKSRILINGFRKRQKVFETEQINAIRTRWGLPEC